MTLLPLEQAMCRPSAASASLHPHAYAGLRNGYYNPLEHRDFRAWDTLGELGRVGNFGRNGGSPNRISGGDYR